MSDPLFDWVPFFEELATKLRQFRNRQHELIQVLIELKAAGHLVPSLTDRGPNGVDLPLAEIDPFTFLASLNRGITDARRLALARAFKDRFKLATEVPRSFAGVPVVDNRKTWFFAFSVDRDPADIPSLWDVFELALNTDPLSDPQFAVALDRAFNIRGVRINITMGLFWIRPRIFPSLDSVLLKYLGLPSPSKLNSTNYFNAVRAITARGTDYVQLSYDAWMAAAAPETPPDEAPNAETLESLDRDPLDAPIFWFVGASWQPGGDQTERFLSEGVWENGFHDGSLREEVRSMRPGERIAIKATYTRKRGLPFPTNGGSVSVMRIKVIGTIVENPGDGQRVHVRWDSSFAPKEWYFFTNRRTLWSVSRGANPYSDFLIAFTFYGATQNYEWFVSQSYWQRQISGPPKSGVASPVAEKPNDEDAEFDDEASTPPYGVSDMTAEGAFVSEAQLTRFLSRLHDVKNLILQGPPGVGKTWFAKRLAFALMGERDEERVTRVQFHQTTSYEDFVRGLRPKPDGSGAFALVDGPFVEAAEAARADPSNRPHVVIIEEVNRGNPSQIFGELLTLLEWDKRSPEHGLKLVHSRESEPPFYVPENLFLIGTMNLADRSLAIVDFALRRRFAFETIPACFDDRFRAYVGKIGLPIEVATEIAQRMAALNEMISADPNLGSSYAVGHSFFCPTPRQAASPDAWYTGVIETQILPLLEEYWFDQRANITKAQKLLLDGFPS